MQNQDSYDSLILKYSSVHNRNPKQVKKQIRVESNFDHKAMNPRSKAKGLMQFMDRTWLEWYDGKAGISSEQATKNPFDPEANINAGCAYMTFLEKMFDGSLEKALAAYNYGPGNVKKLISRYSNSWKNYLPTETSNYIKKCSDFDSELLTN